MLFLVKKLLCPRGSVRFTSTDDKYNPIVMSRTVYEPKVQDSKEPLIVLPGTFSFKEHWANVCTKLLEDLRPRCKIIAVDLRNHGDSPRSDVFDYRVMSKDLKALIEELKVSSVKLLSHSLGGKVAMQYCLKYPETVSSLVVVDIAPIRYHHVKALELVIDCLDSVKLPVNVDLETARALANKQLKEKIQRKQIRHFLILNLVQDKDGSYRWKCNLPVFKANVNNILAFPEVKGTFEKPILFMGGLESNLIMKSHESEIKAYFPYARTVYFSEAHHDLHIYKPHEFIEECLKFFNDQ